ncbi:MAG: SEC-C metal-binding domain-containing protein [Actinomycetota bacterium]
MDEDRLREEARQLLRRLGPQTPQELAQRLDEEMAGRDDEHEIPTADTLRELLLEPVDQEFSPFPLTDGRLCDLEHLIDGLVLTHVITEDERADGAVDVDPDLTPLHLLSDDGRTFPLTDGSSAYLDVGSNGRLRAPKGWLPQDPVLCVRIVGGSIEVAGRSDAPEVDTTLAERLARTLTAVRERQAFPVDAVELVLEARARYPRLLSDAQAPLSMLLAAQGIRATDHGLRTADEPEAHDGIGEEIDGLIEHLREDHRLDEQAVTALLHVYRDIQQLEHDVLEAGVTAMRARLEAGEDAVPTDGDGDDDLTTAREALGSIDLDAAAEELATLLADTEAALALVDDVVGDDPLTATCLLVLLEQAPPPLPARPARANLAWVRAQLLESVADDHAEAERELRRALELDEHHGPASFALARYLSLRGRAGPALGLLHRIEGPNVEELIELLTPYAQPGPASAGRNEPCPCGSGRKHKVCCQPHNGWPLADRLDWVWHKVVTFMAGPRGRELVDPVLHAAGLARSDTSANDVAVLNLSLFEGGLLAELCDVCGSLLPADELELLRDWSWVRARAYELLATDADGTCTVLDLRTGERTTFVDHSIASDVDPGTAILAWLVDEPGGTVPSYGLIVVPDHRREDVLDLLDEEPSATDLASWYRSLFAPPRLATTAGDPLVMTTLTYQVPDGEAARAALSDHLDDDGDTLTASEERDGQRWLSGSVEVDGDQLIVSTTSTPRSTWFADLIARVVPDAQLIDEERLPFDDAMASSAGDGDGDEHPAAPLDLDTLEAEERAQIEEQLEGFMRQHEDSWVDTPLPALGGSSPRQAVDDPTRREQLLRLLDDMERDAAAWSGPGRGMDADRLRALLGL